MRRRGRIPGHDSSEQQDMRVNAFNASSAGNLSPEGTGPADVALERHYTVGQIAKSWHADYKTVRRMFEGEPGVLIWGPGERRFKRSHVSMRIPESVVIRVHRKYRMCRNPL